MQVFNIFAELGGLSGDVVEVVDLGSDTSGISRRAQARQVDGRL